MRRSFLILILVSWLPSCGKNDGFVNIPNQPGYFPGGIGQAPPPGYFPPVNPFPPQIGGPSVMPPPFRPQLPPGMPPGYTPFLPVDYFFRQTPPLMPVWNQIWTGWQQYAPSMGYGIYDFSAFWFNYCPQVFVGPSLAPLYESLDVNFYSWASPQMSFAPYMDPSYFWSGYANYPYTDGGFNLYVDVCSYGC